MNDGVLSGLDDLFKVGRPEAVRAKAREAGRAMAEGLFDEDPNRVFDLSEAERAVWEDLLIDGVDSRFDAGSEAKASLPGVSTFLRETFGRLLANQERIEDVKPEDGWAAKAHDVADGLQEFRDLAKLTRGDVFHSTLGAVTIASEVMKHVPEPPEPIEDPESLERAADAIEDLEAESEATEGQPTGKGPEDGPGLTPMPWEVEGEPGSGEGAGNTQGDDVAGPSSGGGSPLADALRERAAKARASLEDLAASMDEDELRRAVRDAAEKIREEVDSFNEACDGIGWGNGPGQSTPSDPRAKVELAKVLRENRKMATLMEIVGRLVRIASRKQKTKTKEGRETISGVELGNDLGRALPEELLLAKMGRGGRAQFAAKLHNRTLLQYAWSGKEKEGRGPVVLFIDDSSSMGKEDCGGYSREVVAKAIGLAVASICRKQRRDLHVIFYANTISGEFVFPKGEITFETLVEFCSCHNGGGTSWEEPVNRADEITKAGSWKKADLLMVSDGDCRFSVETRAKLDAMRGRDVEMKAVLIRGGKSDKFSLGEGCGGEENVAAVADLFDDSAHEAVFKF